MMFSLGIDIGHSAIKIAALNTANEVVQVRYIPHNGRVRDTLVLSLEAFVRDSSHPRVDVGAITGNAADLLDSSKRFLIANDIEALVEGSLLACKEARSVISIGCQRAAASLRGRTHACAYK
jgi:activator of 2-hydroxyglutaryl-CoA dehydratase